MFTADPHPTLIPFNRDITMRDLPASIKADNAYSLSKSANKKLLKKYQKELDTLQQALYANNKHSILLVFQAMDAAGKDSTIRAVLKGINPAGCQVFSFKQPSSQELDHDFLWRSAKSLPERGRIGVFNRSYYEEVLVIKVHPEYLGNQNLPFQPALDNSDAMNTFWDARYQSINDHEKHLATNGTLILKFFLNVSQEEQHRRFLSRIERPEKNWKFSPSDLSESKLWDQYQSAYEDLLNKTSKPWAPWYAIPADDKKAMRLMVCDIIRKNMQRLDLPYPSLNPKIMNDLDKYKQELTKNT